MSRFLGCPPQVPLKGPDKADLFFDNPALYDPNTTKPHVRQNIFGRIRAPVKDGDKANEALRDKQANVRFMPRLSGDLGEFAFCLFGVAVAS